MIFVILFIAALIWRALYDNKPSYIDPVVNDAERRRLMVLIEQMEFDRIAESIRKRQEAIQLQINEICKAGIESLTRQFEAGEITQQEYDEGLDLLLDEMKPNLTI